MYNEQGRAVIVQSDKIVHKGVLFGLCHNGGTLQLSDNMAIKIVPKNDTFNHVFILHAGNKAVIPNTFIRAAKKKQKVVKEERLPSIVVNNQMLQVSDTVSEIDIL